MKSLTARLAGCFALAVLGMAGAPAVARDCEGAASDTKLTVVVEDVRSDRGQLTATLYPGDASKFLKPGGALRVWRSAPARPATALCIWLPGPGVYSVAVYHDVNSNGKWDHNIVKGIEPVWFSDNPYLAFSPPKFEATAFKASGPETTIHVKLIHK
jgi:uncharacterized protein (DUF2141 family)